MKIFKAENVFNQRKLLTHLLFGLFSVLIVFINSLINPATKSWNDAVAGFILIFSQVELFIFLAHLIFSNMKEGRSRAEISRIVLSRFALFIAACFAGAFVVIIIFLYGRQIIRGDQLSGVLNNFFSDTFRGWLKATLGGLAFGGIIFIIVLWQDALRREQKIREESLIFQNETLKNQINPHFLFNSLNTLSSLITTQPDNADRFISKLSSIYRYILENSRKDKVPLKSELTFISDYFDLHKVRGEEKISLRVDAPEADKYEILPVSLQILIENAIKHNKATRENPLEISIFIEDRMIVVRNNLQRMATRIGSTGIGLKNLSARAKLISGKEMIIEQNDNFFIVKLPLLK